MGWIVDIGSDFPSETLETINSWHTSAVLRHDKSRLTTRGWNSISPSGFRDFKYLTKKKRLDADDLNDPAILRSRSFHFICSAERCVELVGTIQAKRKALEPQLGRPIYIWEPVPACMVPDELLNLTRALPYVDICSPNAAELGQLLGYPLSEVESPTGDVNPDFVETATTQLLESMPLSSFAIVVRCGKSGLYVGKNGGRSSRVSFFEESIVADARETRRAKRNSKEYHKRRAKLGRSGKTFTVNTLSAPTPSIKPSHMHGGLTADTDMMALFAHLEAKTDGSDDDNDSGGDEEEDDFETSFGENDDASESIPSVRVSEPSANAQEIGNGKDENAVLHEDVPDYGTSLWLPAYHTNADRVIDPTGGGNTFLGGLAIGLARGAGLTASCSWAMVAASYAIEQVGMPILTLGENYTELWNGSSVSERLADYNDRIDL